MGQGTAPGQRRERQAGQDRGQHRGRGDKQQRFGGPGAGQLPPGRAAGAQQRRLGRPLAAQQRDGQGEGGSRDDQQDEDADRQRDLATTTACSRPVTRAGSPVVTTTFRRWAELPSPARSGPSELASVARLPVPIRPVSRPTAHDAEPTGTSRAVMPALLATSEG
jgi:hypothetical protein